MTPLNERKEAQYKSGMEMEGAKESATLFQIDFTTLPPPTTLDSLLLS